MQIKSLALRRIQIHYSKIRHFHLKTIMIHEKYKYSQYQLNKLQLWKDYLSVNEALLTKRFSKIIERYSRENRSKLPKEEKRVVELEFFHGSGDLNFSFNAKTVEEEEFNKIYEGYYIVPEYDWYQPQKNHFYYPEELDIFYEEFREHRSESEKWHLTFDWLVKNWIKLGGHRIGLICGTWQNNAASTFSFNLLNWDDCIELPQPKSNIDVKYPLNRDLNEFEIESRVRFTKYEPFIQKFRYFEKDQVFFEIAYYANLVGYRTGSKSEYSEIPFDVTESEYEYRNMRFDQYKRIAIRVDELINSGFVEKEKPNAVIDLKENLIEWDFGPFVNGFESITKSAIHSLEEYLGHKIPTQYLWFLKHMNNVKSIWEISNFRIKYRTWKKFESFFSLKELKNEHDNFYSNKNIEKEFLPIAKDTENGFVLVHLKTAEVFYSNASLSKTHNNFKKFIRDCAQVSEYFYPMRYHLEKDNIKIVRKWISEGIDIADESLYGGRKPIQISRNFEISKLLCQHDADPNDFHLFKEMGLEYIKMLIHYGLDLKVKLETQEWFKNVILENEEYSELRNLIQE